ncbi:MFS transporter [Aeoliella mucimassa]|uniref:Multidrug resistance protein MdtH n=1 Tax=Aeoliella mucimassa TaxID=2527972 RepID=A0A518AJ28_9BACT|nr:MFS transporter [Aeoliella mucimassa]QDU54737.1 multidrug resistance protein MdtH [Aeoliella mucimassa]
MVRRIANSYRESYSGLPRELWIVALSLWINRCGAMVLAYLAIYLHESKVAMPESEAGRMISVFGVGSILGTLIGARLVEAVGAVRVQTLCMLLAAPLYWFIPAWTETWAIVINILLLSSVNEAVRPANSTLIAKLVSREDRSRAFALQRLAANLGFAFGGLMGGVVASYDYRLLFVVNGSTTLVAGLVLLWYFRLQRLPGEAKPSEVRVPGPVTDPVFIVFLGLFLLSTLVFFQLLSNYTLYLHGPYSLSERQIGILFAVNTLIVVIFEMPLVDWVKRWPAVRVVGWGCALSCLGFGILPFGSTFGFAIFGMAIVSLGEMLCMPLAASYAANRSPVGAEGQYIGWWSMSIALAFVLGPAIGSWLYSITPNLVWYASLGIAGVVFVGFYLLPKNERHTHDPHDVLPAPDAGDLLADSAAS